MVDKESRVVVAVSREEFADIVRAAVREALAAVAPPGALSTQHLARALDVSVATINRLTAEGMPHERVGKARRYDLQRCREWLAARKAAT